MTRVARVSRPVPARETDVELGSHVTVLIGDANGKYPDGNSTLVVGSHGAVVIDPALSVHQRGGVPGTIDHVLVSHAHEDHMAGIGALGVERISVHHADLQGVRTLDGLMEVYGLVGGDEDAWRTSLQTSFHFDGWPSATGFGDGEVFELGGVSVRVLHLPGHTRGHSAFIVEPDGVAFVGDVDLSSFGPYYGDHWSDLDDFVGSLARVRDVEARHYVTFHHKGVIDGHAEFVRQLDAFASVIDRRDERLLRMLQRPQTHDELAAEGIVYRAGTRPPSFGDSVERRTIAMHVERLVRAGMVAVDGDRFVAA